MRLFSAWTLIGIVSLSCCAGSPDPDSTEAPAPAAQSATLTIHSRYAPGDSHWKVIHCQEGTTVSATMHHAYNNPTGDSSWTGDLHPVYLAINDGIEVGGECHDVGELELVMKQEGWSLVREESKVEDFTDIRVLHYER